MSLSSGHLTIYETHIAPFCQVDIQGKIANTKEHSSILERKAGGIPLSTSSPSLP
jgi:hypothetical protein